MSPRFDSDAVAALIREVAETEVRPFFRHLSAHQIREKSRGDFVTDVDEAVERSLTQSLAALLPGSTVVGEEAVEADRSGLDRFRTDAPVWVIDPIDGTSNFARGEPTYAIMVGLVHRNETLAGWIYDPEGDVMAVAERGAGTLLDGRPARLAPGGTPAEMRGSLHGNGFADARLVQRVSQRRDRVQAQRSLRCAGHEYLKLLRGEMDFTLFTKTKPWDHVPGALMQIEAGGTALKTDGSTYLATDFKVPQGILAAPDRASWESLREALLGEA